MHDKSIIFTEATGVKENIETLARSQLALQHVILIDAAIHTYTPKQVYDRIKLSGSFQPCSSRRRTDIRGKSNKFSHSGIRVDQTLVCCLSIPFCPPPNLLAARCSETSWADVLAAELAYLEKKGII